MLNNDELLIYLGSDYSVSKHISIRQPALLEVAKYGELKFYSMVYYITATPQSLKWQLWDSQIDYTTLSPWELFYKILYSTFGVEDTKILFGDLDFQKFEIRQRSDNNEIFLYQMIDSDEVIIDEYTYNMITDYLRAVFNIKKDEKIPGNESTKMILIEDAKEEYLRQKNEEHHSQLKNLVSAMVNSEGFKFDYNQVWDMKINAFMDSVSRISKIKSAELLLHSGYSGFGIDLNKVSKKQLDWLGELA